MKKIFLILFAFLFVGAACEQVQQPPLVQESEEEIIVDEFSEPEPEQLVEKAPNAMGDANKCSLVPDIGPCRGNFTRYYYDLEKGCTEFFWGGCQGVVPFESLNACQSLCGKIVLGENVEQDVDPEQSQEPQQIPQQPLQPVQQPQQPQQPVKPQEQPKPEKLDCNPGLGPVCTADNMTYPDDCSAEAAGKIVTMWGQACPEEEPEQPVGCTDNDNDGAYGGVGCTPYDCDDNSKYIPFDFEVCIDGLDNDCDGKVDEDGCKNRRICLGEGCASTITYID